MPRKYTPDEAIEAFWQKVDLNGPTMPNMETPCWVWAGAMYAKGYGIFSAARKTIRAHRYSWVLTNGEIPNGLFVLHECDNRRCVRPEHLFLGTARDNTRDMIEKGRARPVQGKSHGNAKLTDEIVREARRRSEAGEAGDALAREYGVSGGTMSMAINRKTWRHVT